MKLVKKIMLLVLSTLFLTTTVCSLAINAFAEETANTVTILAADGTIIENGTAKAPDHGGAIVTAPASYLETEATAAQNPAGWDTTGVQGFSLDVSGWNKDKMWISYYLYISDVSGLGNNSCRTTFNDSAHFWYTDNQIVASLHEGWNLIKMPTSVPAEINTITQVSVTINTSNKPAIYVTDINLCDDGSVTAWSATKVALYGERVPETLSVFGTDGTVLEGGKAKGEANGGAIVKAPTSYLETEIKAAQNPEGWDATGIEGLSIDVSGWNKNKMWISYYLYISDVSNLGDNGCRTTFNDSANFWYTDGAIVSSLQAGWNFIKMPTHVAEDFNTITQISVTINTPSDKRPTLLVTDIKLCDDGKVTAWSATKVATSGEVIPIVNEITVLSNDGTVLEGGKAKGEANGGAIVTAPTSYVKTNVKAAQNPAGWDATGVENLSIDLSSWEKDQMWISYYLYISDVSNLGDNGCRTTLNDSENYWYTDGAIVSSLQAGWNLIKMPIHTSLNTINQISVTINTPSDKRPTLLVTDIKLCDDNSVTAWSATKVADFVKVEHNVTLLGTDGTVYGNGTAKGPDHGGKIVTVPASYLETSVQGAQNPAGWDAAGVQGFSLDISEWDTDNMWISYYLYITDVSKLGDNGCKTCLNDSENYWYKDGSIVSSLQAGWNYIQMPIHNKLTEITQVFVAINTENRANIYVTDMKLSDDGSVTEWSVTKVDTVKVEEVKPLDLSPVSIIGAENPKAIGAFEKSNSIVSTTPVGMTGKSLSLDATNNDSKGWFTFDDMQTGINAADLAASGNAALDFWVYISDVTKLHRLKFCIQKADPVTGNGQAEWNFWALYEAADAVEAGFVNGWNHVTIKAINLGNDGLYWDLLNKMFIDIEWKDSTARNCFIYDLKLISVEQEERIVITNQVAPELTVSDNKTLTYSKDGFDLNEYVTLVTNDAAVCNLYFICNDELIEDGLFMPENKNETYTVQVQLRADNFAAITKTIEITVEADETVESEPSDPNDPVLGDDEPAEGCGQDCSASIGGTGAMIAAVLALAGTMFVCKKKND